ncbi:MAG: hypothetical protein M1817_001410 [Caeruleum heppii]|nr:MAG: hypothetical protein M1817_001410 [Caeruleum heppii]
MPRQQRRAAPSRPAPRPTAAPARQNVTPPQPPSRSATTMANRQPTAPARAGPPAAAGQQQSGGLFRQMASTAAGVAVGSSIGHAIGGFFGGGSSQAAAPAADHQMTTAPTQEAAYGNTSEWVARSCEADAKTFTKCLDENGGNMQICGWYLDQLKACQAAAKPY